MLYIAQILSYNLRHSKQVVFTSVKGGGCLNREIYIRKASELIAEALGLLTNDELGVIRGVLQQAGEFVDKRSHAKSFLKILEDVALNLSLLNQMEGNYLQ